MVVNGELLGGMVVLGSNPDAFDSCICRVRTEMSRCDSD